MPESGGRSWGAVAMALVLGACGSEAFPLTERVVLLNERPFTVFVDARCGEYRLELLRIHADGTLERLRYRATHCGVCSCDEACSCPPCPECSPEPEPMKGGERVQVLWSGEEHARARDPRCGVGCLTGSLVPPGRYLARLCYSPWPFSSADVATRSRSLVCTEQEFDPFAEREVALVLGGGAPHCDLDSECGGTDMRCNASTTVREQDGTLRSGMDGEGLCRQRCGETGECGTGLVCTRVELRRDESVMVERLCLPEQVRAPEKGR